MQIDNPIRLIRELKGAPLSIVLVLRLVPYRVTQEFLERATGYTDKPVSQALAYLAEIGMATHTREGWQLVREAEQLTLGLELEEHLTTETQSKEEKNEELGIENEELGEVSRNISDSVITTIKDSLIKEDLSSSNSNNGAGSRKNSDSDLESALKTAGIKGQKLRALVSRGGLRPGDVLAWEAELRERYGDRYGTGLLVTVLESGEPAPERRGNGHKPGCHCHACWVLEEGGDGDE